MPTQKPKGKPSGKPPAGPEAVRLTYPIPSKSGQAWKAFQRGNGPHNPGLIFDRFAPDWNGNGTLKKTGLEAVREAAKKIDTDLLVAWNARWEQTAGAVHAEPLSLKTDWRFIAGLGRKGPLEVGFTFHRYGFPILPGSSVKGVARAWATFALGGVEQAEANSEFVAIFGRTPKSDKEQSVAQSGGAIFFDAIPGKLPRLELDIMNPHYPDYYGDKSNRIAPTDWQSPRPVYFLTVAPNTEFRFAVGWRESLTDKTRRLRDKAKEWLIKSLMELGAGAKTSAGYGYFK